MGGDTNLLLRCCSAVLTKDASPQALMSLNGSTVRDGFEYVTNGVKYAIDYVRSNFCAQTLNNLPFPTLLVPLSVFFAAEGNRERSVTDKQRTKINRWFWRSAFSKRYSAAVLRNLNNDIEQMVELRDKLDSQLGEFPVPLPVEFFTDNTFGLGNVNTKTFVLMLASAGPRSFISGVPVDLKTTIKEANRTEYHHLMPKAFLDKSGQTDKYDASVLANFAFLSRADNRRLGGDAPSAYRSKMPHNVDDIMISAICPGSALFADDFTRFIESRSAALLTKACALCGLTTISSIVSVTIEHGAG